MELLSFENKLTSIIDTLGTNHQDGSFSFSNNNLLIKKEFNHIKLFFDNEFIWSSSLNWSNSISLKTKTFVLNLIDETLNKEIHNV